jgi:hypothetical protein
VLARRKVQNESGYLLVILFGIGDVALGVGEVLKLCFYCKVLFL